jgi:hypothetical protein
MKTCVTGSSSQDILILSCFNEAVIVAHSRAIGRNKLTAICKLSQVLKVQQSLGN